MHCSAVPTKYVVLLQRCRLNTIQGKQVYFPVFFKLYNEEFINKYHRGNTSMLLTRHKGHWAHYSYGMVCLYTADYRKSGGFDLSMQGWGEEDVDLMSKVQKVQDGEMSSVVMR